MKIYLINIVTLWSDDNDRNGWGNDSDGDFGGDGMSWGGNGDNRGDAHGHANQNADGDGWGDGRRKLEDERCSHLEAIEDK